MFYQTELIQDYNVILDDFFDVDEFLRSCSMHPKP